jgi:hypothetical protein
MLCGMFVMPVEAQQEATVTKIPEQYQPRGKRKRRVSLLDIGLEAAFDASMMFVQSVLQTSTPASSLPLPTSTS